MTLGLVGTAACEPIKTATPQYLTAEQVGELLQVSPRTVQRWALEDASMPATRLGRVVRFEREPLLRWLALKRPRVARCVSQLPTQNAPGVA